MDQPSITLCLPPLVEARSLLTRTVIQKNGDWYFKLDKEFYAVTTKENVDIDFINFHFFHFLKIYSVKTIISRKC